MKITMGALNWPAILVCVLVGQVFLTLWFALVFKKPWAKAYGVDDPTQHTQEIPGYTYGLGALCVFLLATGLSFLQTALNITSVKGMLMLGLAIAVHFTIATSLPGYAFLKRWNAFWLAIGSQTALVIILCLVLSFWI